MGWFQKERQPDIWEAAEVAPVGDIEAAQQIRAICASAGSIVEKMSALGGRNAEKKRAAEAERYQAAIKRALELARQISDDLMRDTAVTQIIRLCMKLDHLKTARVLLRALRSEKTQGELLAEHPALRDQEAAS